jgi:predicted transcriptional regulator
MQNALALLQKHKNGMSRKELEGILDSKEFRMKNIHQLIHMGLVRQTDSSYYITGKGSRVLEACRRY